jgi:hypothetical protein
MDACFSLLVILKPIIESYKNKNKKTSSGKITVRRSADSVCEMMHNALKY